MLKQKGIYISLFIIVIVIQLFQYFKGNEQIVFIDNQKIFNEFKMAKELNAKLEVYNLKYKSVIDSLDIELTKRGSKLDVDDTLEVKKYLRFKEYCTKEAESFYTKANELNTDYNTQIINQMNSYIEELGKENHYQIILGANGQGGLLYANKGIDITDIALIYVNNKYEGN